MISIGYESDFESWRDRARDLLARGVPPEEVDWTDSAREDSLFAAAETEAAPRNDDGHDAGPSWRVPAGFVELARMAWAHRDPRRPAVLYRLLWRLTRGGEKPLLSMVTDPDLRLAADWRKSVARDIHKTHAFVRFRLVGVQETTGREQFVAWFEPSSR